MKVGTIPIIGVPVDFYSSLHQSLNAHYRNSIADLEYSQQYPRRARLRDCGESVNVYLHLLEWTVRPPATGFLHETETRTPACSRVGVSNQVPAGLRYNKGDIGQDSAPRPILLGQISPADSFVDL